MKTGFRVQGSGFRIQSEASAVIAAVVLLVVGAVPVLAQSPPRLLIAVASYRERPQQPQVYFYEHDGVGEGKVTGSIPTAGKRSDHHPSLSRDGRYCAFAAEVENETSRILLWDQEEKKNVELPTINDSPNAQLHPALSGDARFVVFAAWNRPSVSQRWDLLLYDVFAKQTLPLPGASTLAFDEQMPAISGDGSHVAYSSNAKGGAGLFDIYLHPWREGGHVPLPGLNSPHREIDPALSGGGQLLAFVSDRPGGGGGRDIYLYDRDAEKLLPLPGLNSVAHEQSPALSPDGRYLAFVSERTSGEGERDVFLYDRQAQKLLPTPGLNSKREDIDPCLIVLPGP